MAPRSFLTMRDLKMAKRKTYITKEGLQQLKEEIGHLKDVKRKEVAKSIRQASESGTVDNAEYDESKNEQAFIEGRILDLEKVISNAIVSSNSPRKNSVQIGSSVTVITQNGDKRLYQVVGSAEAAPLDGKISNESPVGSAILGHKIGDQVKVSTPSGVMKLTISRIR